MKTLSTLLFLALFSFSASVSAQSALLSKMMFHAGFTYEFFTLRPSVGSNEASILPFYGLSGGMNYVLVHSNDQISLLANPNLALAYAGGYNGSLFMVQAPVFVSARVGAGATPFNENKFGFGAGAGVNVNYLYGNGAYNGLNHTLFLPSAMVEMLVNGRNSFYAIRAHFTLIPEQKKLGGDNVDFSNFGLSINYSF